MSSEEIAEQLLKRAQGGGRIRCWPSGAPHEGALRLALSSAISLAAHFAQTQRPWRLALDDVLQRADVGRLQRLLTDLLDPIHGAHLDSTEAVMHLRIAALALVDGDRAEAKSHFLSAQALEEGDQIAERGLAHLGV